ncbi:M48 family metalloprotease [Sphingomonas oligophenolica]|uniref:LysM peptidoglycan-binding domain-containing protein n=1 Tax=Sphingomonas oligophenolica TaxID=301154 RepID=A0A502CNC4_9SPHN|nr:M48 family metalloprotease [Sphingomonas oligophenolica]TPG13191.1 LysM peptidoglycan-binding domain-containing protein [Sphingomonas oligophenolica]
MRHFISLALLLSTPALAQTNSFQTGRAAPITAAERQQGNQTNASITAQYGGALAGRQAAYVEAVGRRIAVQSGLSSSPQAFDVKLLNSPVENAFAIPGGYVYVTRNLVALMNDEAELAAVMGHEVGHVAARHSAKRQSAATRNSIFGSLGQAIVGAIAGNSAIGGLLSRGVGVGSQLATLGYSRGQETQADDLAIRYLASAGYDPLALSTVLESLARQTALEGRISGDARAVPQWASTHPDPAARVRRAAQQAAAIRGGEQARNRDAFLTAIDGMMYGDDPQQGVIDGRTFLYPAFGVAFDVPQGFTLQNGSDAVAISGQGAQANFGALPFTGDLDRYVQSVVQSIGGSPSAAPLQRNTVNGFRTAYTQLRAVSSNTPVDVTIFAYQLGSTRAAHFVIVAPAGSGAGALEPMLGSLRRLSNDDAARVRPRYLRAVTVRSGDTAQSLSARMAYDDLRLERFLVLNRLDPREPLQPGEKVKVVTY